MELDTCIEKRRSQRKFIDKELPLEVVAKIVKAGTMSPNAGNLQAWRFIIITDSKTKEKVAMACEEQLWMCEAGALIAICSDLRDIERFYADKAKLFATQDASASAENMILKATDMGVGSCWVAAFDESSLKDALSLPGYMAPQVVITLGYSEEKAKPKPKLKIEELIYLNQFGKKPGEFPEIAEIIKKLIEKGKKAVSKLKK